MAEPTIPNLPITGHCLCGLVRFEVTEPLTGAHYCHCTRCQRRTGTAFSASASAVPGSFHVTEGEELVRAYHPPDGWAKFFCGECGGHVYSQSNTDPDQVGVRMGAIDGDPGVRPRPTSSSPTPRSGSRLPDDGLPRYDERTPA